MLPGNVVGIFIAVQSVISEMAMSTLLPRSVSPWPLKVHASEL